MSNIFGPNWKTTVTGIFTALFGFVVFSPDTFKSLPWLIELSKFAAAGGLVMMGLSGKDSNVTGGTKPNE